MMKTMLWDTMDSTGCLKIARQAPNTLFLEKCVTLFHVSETEYKIPASSPSELCLSLATSSLLSYFPAKASPGYYCECFGVCATRKVSMPVFKWISCHPPPAFQLTLLPVWHGYNNGLAHSTCRNRVEISKLNAVCYYGNHLLTS